MDKMIQSPDGSVLVTNDGATILNKMNVFHPAAKMLVGISSAQDVEAGDGTTSVVVLCGSMLQESQKLLSKGIHPSVISRAWGKAVTKAEELLEKVATPVELSDRNMLIQAAKTSLSSKVISQYADIFAPIAVDSVLRVIDTESATNVDLNDIRLVTRVGGTMDDTELVDGIVFGKGLNKTSGGSAVIENAKVGLIQFCLSAPKTDIDNQVVVSEYSQMDRILRQERKYILKLCKMIKKSGCNVLLVQKSILRDAVNDLSLHFLAKLGIAVVTNIEREDVEFICKSLGCKPVAHIDQMKPSMLGSAARVEEATISGKGRVVKITGIQGQGKTCSILVRGSNQVVLEEADRSLHDALCVVRSLVKKRYLIAGGGAPEIEVAHGLQKWSQTLSGQESYCARAFASAMEVIPYTLAENAGLNPIAVVTELRRRHAQGESYVGINVRKGCITDIRDESVWQPLLISVSALTLATETVQMLLKIDDQVAVR
jgi:T-complex protein 1 subunit delta